MCFLYFVHFLLPWSVCFIRDCVLSFTSHDFVFFVVWYICFDSWSCLFVLKDSIKLSFPEQYLLPFFPALLFVSTLRLNRESYCEIISRVGRLLLDKIAAEIRIIYQACFAKWRIYSSKLAKDYSYLELLLRVLLKWRLSLPHQSNTEDRCVHLRIYCL